MSRKPRILIADDEPQIARVLRTGLNARGYETRVAADGVSALETFGDDLRHHPADGRLDAMVALRPVRSVDAAAGQLIVREAGGEAAFPEAGDGGAPLSLDMRSRVLAARDPAMLERLLVTFP